MTIEPKIYKRNRESVQAVQITRENIREVADWSGGIVRQNDYRGNSRPHIEFIVPGSYGRHSTQAFIGGWVVKDPREQFGDQKFTFIPESYFKQNFTQVTNGLTEDEELFEKIRLLVQGAMSKQDVATYRSESHTVSHVAEQTAREIVKIVKDN